MSNNVIDTNILGNKVTSIKTRSNMAKILKKSGQNSKEPTYFQKF